MPRAGAVKPVPLHPEPVSPRVSACLFSLDPGRLKDRAGPRTHLCVPRGHPESGTVCTQHLSPAQATWEQTTVEGELLTTREMGMEKRQPGQVSGVRVGNRRHP